MKAKAGSGDPEEREAKSGLASSESGRDTSRENAFFADAVSSSSGKRCGHIHNHPYHSCRYHSFLLHTGFGQTRAQDHTNSTIPS